VDALGGEVRALVLEFVPASWTAAELADGLEVVGGGLGLDSIRATELLFACEDCFAVRIPIEALEAGALTVGRLVALVRAAGGRAAGSP
jgi:acyl carrier protein